MQQSGTPCEHASEEVLVRWLATLPAAERTRWLEDAVAAQGDLVRPLMMEARDIRTLIAGGVAVAAHGASHTPLTDVADLDSELKRCADAVAAWTGKPARALAYPHGRYSPGAVDAASQAGFTLQFTSEPHLNRLANGRPLSPVFGRLDMPEAELVDARGAFDAERLAYWLTMRPVRGGP
jgi:peptidoglycan/xylan/chitin deacetylase (PgdA/CDA1 family)